MERFKLMFAMVLPAVLLIDHSWCINTEGLALLKFRDGIDLDPFGVLSGWSNGGDAVDLDHCSWFGVECSDGKVVALCLI
ncbi:putative non-specific serine/threonine protein kinase [Helianthus anomalus]